MAQMKEQKRIPEKELNKMEISNLSDAEFKTLVTRMLKELIGYIDSIRKTQANMKVTLSEINKNLRGTNNVVNEVKTQINDLELKEEKRSTQNSKKKKESKKTRIG